MKPLAVLFTLAAACAPAKKETAPMTTTTSGYAPVNGRCFARPSTSSLPISVVMHKKCGTCSRSYAFEMI